jgi:hypothetical protein
MDGKHRLVATEHNRRSAEAIQVEAWKTIRQGKSHLLQIQAVPFNEAGEKFLAWADVQHAKKPNTARRVRASFASLFAHFGRTAVASITPGDVLD